MNLHYIIAVAILLFGLFHLSLQKCLRDRNFFHYYYSHDATCFNVTNLKDEIKAVEYYQYLNNIKINYSNLITIDNLLSIPNRLQSLTITNCKIGTIVTNAFESDRVSKLIIENNEINQLNIAAFNASSLMESLSLRNNSLTEIDSEIFSGSIPALRSLDLSYNNIKTIKGFINLTSLIKLDISHNYYLQSNVLTSLKKLTSLKELNINNCNLYEIPTNGFSELRALEKIDLTGNKFSTLRGNVFPPSLIFLFVSDNSISYISDSWSHLNNLTTVDLSNNQLASQNYPFENCISLTTLKLKNNRLDDSFLNNAFDKLNKLVTAQLDNNKFTILDCKTFAPCTQLQEISASSNNINSLVNIEQCPKSITKFNMSNNRLSRVNSFSEIPNLIQLDLSNNELENLDFHTFKNLSKLNALYLNGNKFNSLPIGCFRDLNTLRTLKLEHNFISQFGHGSFTGLSNLAELNIAYNELREIDEEVFSSLKSLVVFDISWNKFDNFDVARALSHIKHPIRVQLDGNKYSCSYLARILRSNEIVYGSVFNESNVNGVRCDNASKKESELSSLPDIAMSISSSLNVITVILIILFCAVIGNIVWRFIQPYLSFSRSYGVKFRKEDRRPVQLDF